VVLIYNTMTREIDPIATNHPDLARIYACGPTVYRDAHVGNMRTFLVTDLISRTLHHEGFRTIVVQNITDVGHMADDTGLGGANESLPASQDKMLAESEKPAGRPSILPNTSNTHFTKTSPDSISILPTTTPKPVSPLNPCLL